MDEKIEETKHTPGDSAERVARRLHNERNEWFTEEETAEIVRGEFNPELDWLKEVKAELLDAAKYFEMAADGIDLEQCEKHDVLTIHITALGLSHLREAIAKAKGVGS